MAIREGKPPNLILILADDVSADELSPYGGAISMPNLQKLADEGVLFRNTWATPVCAPSRAMLMTGKYPHHTGYYENPVAPEVPFWKDPRHLPVLKMMKEAGYATSMVGKIHPGDVSDVGMQGAEDWMITWYWPGHDGPRQNHWSPQRQDMYGVSWYWHPGLVQNGKGVPTTSKDFGPDLELKHLLEFTATDRDKPFLACWATNLPHKANEEVAGLPEGRWYYTDVPALDKKGRPTGGKVPGTLSVEHAIPRSSAGTSPRRPGQAGEVKGHHHFLFRRQRDCRHPRQQPGHGQETVYDRDNGIRVPLVVGGGPVKPRGSSEVLVDFTDFWPTFAQFRGVSRTE